MASRPFRLAEDRQRRQLASAMQVARAIGLEEDFLCLGGGAVLQGRWGHRKADGIWLYAGYDAWIQTAGKIHPSQIPAIVEDAGGHDLMNQKRYSMRWRTQDGLTGIHWSEGWNSQGSGLSRQREETSGIRVESILSILEKKVQGRFLALNQFTLRDAVDILACAQRDRRALKSFANAVQGDQARRIREEMLFQMELSPIRSSEPQRSVWLAAAEILAACAEGTPPPSCKDVVLPRTPPIPIKDRDRTTRNLLSLKRFSHPMLSERSSLTSSDAPSTMMHKNMAGYDMDPDSRDIQAWLLAERPQDLPESALGYLEEYMKQLDGEELSELRQNSGASLRDIVRVMGWMGPFKSSNVMNMLNRYARISEGDETEDADGNNWLRR